MSIWKRDKNDDAPNSDLHSSARPTGRRLLLALFGAVVAVAVLILAWPDGLPVELAEVTRGPMQVVISEDGRTRVRDRYVVSAPVTATLLRVDRDPGDHVKQGDPLIEFVPAASPLTDPTSQAQLRARVTASQAALERARAQKDQAEAAVALAEQATERQRVLLETTSGTRVGLERAELEERIRRQDLNSAEFGIKIAEQELAMARMAVRPSTSDDRRTLATAPADGLVLRVFNEGGGLLQAGTPILEVGDPAALEVVIDVLTSDATRIRGGCDVVLERWGGEPLHGVVRLVEPSAFTRVSALGVEEQRVNVIVDPTGPAESWRDLGDGYRIEARIIVWTSSNALQVPVNALFRDGEGWAAFVSEGGKAVHRSVELGEWGDRAAQVLGGLNEGDEVISYPSDVVQDGLRIRR